ncbi:MAG TPA: hypothetical protein VGJ26_06880 [Pirellulales bacterium]
MQADDQFGPWATMFDTGPRARLSTFWKRRMAMLPSTASAEKKLSRRVRLLLLAGACAALSAPTVYLLRAPLARADETTPPARTPSLPVDIAIIEPMLDLGTPPAVPAPPEIASPALGNLSPPVPTTREPTLAQPSAPLREERIVREQVEVAPGKVETIQRRTTVAVEGAPGPQTVERAAPAKRVEFLPVPSQEEEKILRMITNGTISVDFDDTPLTDVVDYLEEKLEIAVELDKSALEDAGVDHATPISIRSKELPLRSVLRRLLPTELTFYVDDDALVITSKEKAENIMPTRTYPVGDLVTNVVAPPAANALPPDLFEEPAKPKAGGMGGGAPKRATAPIPENYARLVQAITSTITPDNWADVGGAAAIVVVPEAKSLVISQSHARHDDIVRLLRALRAARAMADQPQRPAGIATYAFPVPVGSAPTLVPGPSVSVPPAKPAEATATSPLPQELKNDPKGDEAGLASPKSNSTRYDSGGFQ